MVDGPAYEWDRNKAEANFDKHGVDFADAVTALEDELGLTMRDPFSTAEDRFVTLGCVTVSDGCSWWCSLFGTDVIRLISARQATPRERREYEGS